MVVGVDVFGDVGSCLVDGFPFGSPRDSFLELAEPGLDERLGFGVAVTAASVRDPAGGQMPTDPLEVNWVPLSVPNVRIPGATWRSRTACSMQAMASSGRPLGRARSARRPSGSLRDAARALPSIASNPDLFAGRPQRRRPRCDCGAPPDEFGACGRWSFMR